MDRIFSLVESFENIVWGYAGIAAIVILGIHFTFTSRFIQLMRFPTICRSFTTYLSSDTTGMAGVHPLRAFFASIGGCIGIGNVVGVCTAVQIGGPGALFWIWITGFLGMLIKYAEVYIGIRYRVKNDRGGFDGGPMFYLKAAFKNEWVSTLVCLLLCIYGAEVFMFSVVTDTLSTGFGIAQWMVAVGVLPLIILAALGGVQRVGHICSITIPCFIVLFTGMSLYVFWQNLAQMPHALMQVISSAFTGHAATGAFVGSTFIIALSQGVRRACYTADIGIGYASVITSETCVHTPEKQAGLAIFGIVLDTFIVCSFTLFLVLITGAWKEDVPPQRLLETALSGYFPYMHQVVPLLFLVLGFSNMITFFVVGLKCARFLHPRRGEVGYIVFAVTVLMASLAASPVQTQMLMSVTGALLLILNVAGLYKLRKEVAFVV